MAPQSVKLQVSGMHCSACSAAVEQALCGIRGVGRASVSLTLRLAEVEYDASLTSPVSRTPQPPAPTDR